MRDVLECCNLLSIKICVIFGIINYIFKYVFYKYLVFKFYRIFIIELDIGFLFGFNIF